MEFHGGSTERDTPARTSGEEATGQRRPCSLKWSDLDLDIDGARLDALERHCRDPLDHGCPCLPQRVAEAGLANKNNQGTDVAADVGRQDARSYQGAPNESQTRIANSAAVTAQTATTTAKTISLRITMRGMLSRVGGLGRRNRRCAYALIEGKSAAAGGGDGGEPVQGGRPRASCSCQWRAHPSLQQAPDKAKDSTLE